MIALQNRTLALSICLGASLAAMPVFADSTVPWEGSANYGDVETVGPFSRYVFGAGVVLLDKTGSSGGDTFYSGYYQSYVERHELDGSAVSAPLLDSNYELTVAASFSEVATAGPYGSSSIAIVPGGTFQLYLDTSPDRNFATDSGFTDGNAILTGVILGGTGSNIGFGGQVYGTTALEVQITGYDASVFSPDNIAVGSSVFTLRLNSPYDTAFLGTISQVQGHAYDALGGDQKYAAAYGLIDLAAPVPEADAYALILAGFGLLGVLARRKRG